AKNRAAFQQSFWWHDDRSFRLYLRAAKGDAVVREIKHPMTRRVIERQTPSVVLAERPPASPMAAKAEWQDARPRRRSRKGQLDAEVKSLEEARQTCLRLSEARQVAAKQEATITGLAARQSAVAANVARRNADLDRARAEHVRRIDELRCHRRTRPGFFARLLRTKGWVAWSRPNALLVSAEATAATLFETAERELAEAQAAQKAIDKDLCTAEEALATTRQRVAQLSQSVDALRRLLGERLIDEHFFARGHESVNRASP